MIDRIADNIYLLTIPLPDNPLKWLNSYVIKGRENERNLIIDTGFNRLECTSKLLKGMQELELSPENTDVFFTHLHSDHTGNAQTLQHMGCRLIISRTDELVRSRNSWPERKARALAEGMTEDTLRLVFEYNPAVIYAPGPYTADTVRDGEELYYGGLTLECVETPGHTPGHMCLYDRKNRRMFLGDHVLFDITPNICFWSELDDSLGAYIESLEKIMTYDVEIPLPAHRTHGNVTMKDRALALIEHHRVRLAETEGIVAASPGLNAYQIAGKTTWRIRAKNWEDFPPGQKWFAFGETLAHLDFLVKRERLTVRQQDNGIRAYYTNDKSEISSETPPSFSTPQN